MTLEGPDGVLNSHAEKIREGWIGEALDSQTREEVIDLLEPIWQRYFGIDHVEGYYITFENPKTDVVRDYSFTPGSYGHTMISSIAAQFADAALGIDQVAQIQILDDILNEFPVPKFGSPPGAFESLATLATQSPFVAAFGYAAWTDRPVIAVLAGTTAVVIWITKPSMNVLRRSMAERLAAKLGTTTSETDER